MKNGFVSGARRRAVALWAGQSILAAGPLLAAPEPELPPITGQWELNGNLNASIGKPLQFVSTSQPAQAFEFVTMSINGQTGTALKFPAANEKTWFLMEHGTAPNGGGAKVNQYTILMDLMFPSTQDADYRGLIQTTVANTDDADIFLNPLNGIGIDGQYHGDIYADSWHRVALVFDLTQNSLNKYVDGVLENAQLLGQGLDGRWALNPSLLLFTDNDGETQSGYVNSIQFRSGVLTAEQVNSLGTFVTASGIPGGPIDPGGGEDVTLSIVIGPNNNAVIKATPAGSYTLETKAILNAPAWADAPGVARGSEFTVPMSGQTGFFRVRK